jgi:hypothetical protein
MQNLLAKDPTKASILSYDEQGGDELTLIPAGLAAPKSLQVRV